MAPIQAIFQPIFFAILCHIFKYCSKKYIYHLSQYVKTVKCLDDALNSSFEACKMRKKYLIKIAFFGTIVLQRWPPLFLRPLLAEAATLPGRPSAVITAATAAILLHARFLILAGAPQVAQLPSQVVPLLRPQGPYTETIDLCFEPFFVKEIMRGIKWLQEIKTADKWGTTLLYISSNTAK